MNAREALSGWERGEVALSAESLHRAVGELLEREVSIEKDLRAAKIASQWALFFIVVAGVLAVALAIALLSE